MRVQGKRPRTKGMGATSSPGLKGKALGTRLEWGRGGEGRGGEVMFEYVDFLHFDFRGMNLSNLRHYY